MAEEKPEVTDLDELNKVISQLKEMEHYSRSNIEKLTAFWLLFEEKIKIEGAADSMAKLMAAQQTFQDSIVPVIEDYEKAAKAMTPG